MQFNRFTWLDRIGQHLNRRILTKQDGSTETVDVARGDDSVTVEGTPFAAETMNGLESRIEAAFEEGNAQFQQVGTSIAGLETNVEDIYAGTNRVNYIENRCLLDDGSIATVSGYCVTPTLYLPEGNTRTLLWGCRTHTNVGGSGHDMALIVYDGAGAVLATYKARMTSYVTLPAGAKSVVASFYIPDTAENNIMLTLNSEPAYVFYVAKNEKVDGLVGLGVKAESAFSTASGAYKRANDAYSLANSTANEFESGVCSVTSSAGTISKVHSYRSGKIVALHFSLALTKNVAAWETIATVAGALPSEHTAGIFVNASLPANSGVIRILSNGTISALGSLSSGHSLEINFSYVKN